MAGKNKISRGIRLSWDDSGGNPQGLSGDLIPGSVSGPGFTAGEIDMTGESESALNYLADRKDNTVSAQFHMNDTATTGATTVTNGTVGGSAGTLTVQFGSAGAAPTTGDPEWEGEYVLLSNDVSINGGKAIHTCKWRPSGSTAPGWGTVA